MLKLRISSLKDEKPVKITLDLPASLYRDLVAYTDVLAREEGQKVLLEKLIAPMVERFMKADKAFVKNKNARKKLNPIRQPLP